MAVTQQKGKYIKEKAANQVRIAQDKDRARRWAERKRKEKAVHAIPTDTSIAAVAVPCNTNEKSSVLNDLIACRVALLQELFEIDTAIEVIRRTCN